MNARALIIELHGTVCRCGKVKRAGETFCRPCYVSLPIGTRHSLYSRVGQGYEEAYRAAVALLGPVEVGA